MKTITFKGEEKDLNNYKVLPNLKKVEMRVYVLESDLENSEKLLTDEEFMYLAEEQGRVYTLQGFQEAFNLEEINSTIDVIRFISVPIF